MSALKEQLTTAMKDAMRAKDKARLGVVRMALSAIKQIEVDERIELDDERSLAVLDKLIKQRKDSATQYRDAGRDDLAEADVTHDGLGRGAGDGTRETAEFTEEAAQLISRGFSRGQLPDNIVILDKKREEKLSGEEGDDETLNAPADLTDACPNCGSFTLFQISEDGDVECDTCGQELQDTSEVPS